MWDARGQADKLTTKANKSLANVERFARRNWSWQIPQVRPAGGDSASPVLLPLRIPVKDEMSPGRLLGFFLNFLSHLFDILPRSVGSMFTPARGESNHHTDDAQAEPREPTLSYVHKLILIPGV